MTTPTPPTPVQTDNRSRPEDGELDIAEDDSDLDYSALTTAESLSEPPTEQV